MTRRFVVGRLGRDRAEAAYPLARIAVSALTLDQWQRFLSASEGARPGVMVAENERAYIQGLCTHRVVPDLRYGAALAVDDFVVLDMIDGGQVAAALLEALEDEARRQGCAVLHLHLPQEHSEFRCRHPLIQMLREAGHETEAVRFIKLVDGAAA
ncbi:MAG: hypothetical protein WEC41_03510 [Dongiaceae bacterium]